MKNDKFDKQIKYSLNEVAEQFEMPSGMDIKLNRAINNIQAEKSEGIKMKKFNIRKTVIITAAAAMLVGTIGIASGGVATIHSSSSSRPDYKKYSDLATAENKAGVASTNAPESFSNGYNFYGIIIVNNGYANEENQKIDSFKSIEVEYQRGKDRITYEVQPRPMLASSAQKEAHEHEGISYYYTETQNMFVPPNYTPSEEEQKLADEGRLNIGYGSDKVMYSLSKQITWEVDGQAHSLFCMDNDISKDEFLNMAFEIE